MLFVVRPGDDNVNLRHASRDFIQSRHNQARYEMDAAEHSLTKAYVQDNDTKWSEDAIAVAEEHYQTMCALFQTSLLKLKFEERDFGRPRIKPSKNAMPKPWETDPEKWKAIFKHRLY